MNIPLVLAHILLVLAFMAHAYAGDRDLQQLRPQAEASSYFEKWLQARAGWHFVSWDLLLASIGLGLLTWTDYLEPRTLYLQLLVVYLMGAGVAWALTLLLSPKLPGGWWRLGQWGLLWLIGGLVWWGM